MIGQEMFQILLMVGVWGMSYFSPEKEKVIVVKIRIRYNVKQGGKFTN
jgi:hypothetical protein